MIGFARARRLESPSLDQLPMTLFEKDHLETEVEHLEQRSSPLHQEYRKPVVLVVNDGSHLRGVSYVARRRQCNCCCYRTSHVVPEKQNDEPGRKRKRAFIKDV